MQENGILFGVIGYWSSFPVMKYRKLSQPWHGLYRIMDLYETDITVQKVYQAEEEQIQIHRSRVTPFQSEKPAGFFWY